MPFHTPNYDSLVPVAFGEPVNFPRKKVFLIKETNMKIYRIQFLETIDTFNTPLEYLEYQYVAAEDFDTVQDIAHEMWMNYFGDETKHEKNLITDGDFRSVELKDTEEFDSLYCVFNKDLDDVRVPIHLQPNWDLP